MGAGVYDPPSKNSSTLAARDLLAEFGRQPPQNFEFIPYSSYELI